MNYLLKNWKNIVIGILVIICILLILSTNCSNHKNKVLTNNIQSLRDTVELIQLQNGNLLSEKQSLILDNQQLSEYLNLSKQDIKDLQKKIAGEISRGISTGQSYPEIARNIANYANIPKNRAMTIARTEAHRIQCKATLDAQHKAKKKGADVVKQWDASLDGATRSTHRKLDGQIRELDGYFEVNGHKAKHPGGFGKPEEDINCRCALLQRAKWALGEDELETLKERAKFFKLDKSDDFEDFKKKYLKLKEL